MTNSSLPKSNKTAGVLDTAKQVKDIAELGTWVVTTGIALLSFLQTPGSLTQFLVEAGAYGFACYVALFLVLIPVVLFFGRARKAIRSFHK